MAVTVEFVTLGDASKQLKIPAPTLRLWTDELEKYEVHFVKRNHRDERVYYENDLEIFAYMKQLKDEYKRTLRTEDIAKMIYQEAVEHDMFDLRRAEDAPKPEVSDKHLELLNNKDIEALFDSHRVKQFMQYILSENNKALLEDIIKINIAFKDDVVQDVRDEIKRELLQNKTHTQLVLEELEAKRIKREEEREKREEERLARIEENLKLREERSTKMITEWREQQRKREEEQAKLSEQQQQQQKGFFAKLFGK